MKVSLKIFKLRTRELLNIVDHAERLNKENRKHIMAKVKSATHDLFDMECDMADSGYIDAQFNAYKRGIKFIRENDTNI